jgi:hypothetical protein
VQKTVHWQGRTLYEMGCVQVARLPSCLLPRNVGACIGLMRVRVTINTEKPRAAVAMLPFACGAMLHANCTFRPHRGTHTQRWCINLLSAAHARACVGLARAVQRYLCTLYRVRSSPCAIKRDQTDDGTVGGALKWQAQGIQETASGPPPGGPSGKDWLGVSRHQHSNWANQVQGV